jgi:hypothetical protein
LLVTRDLRALPRTQVRIELSPQLRDLLANALQLHIRIGVSGQLAQLFDVFFEALNFLLAFQLFLSVGR